MKGIGMRVKCVAIYPTEELIETLGPGFYRKQIFPLTIGNEYIVLGIEFAINSRLYGTTTLVEIKSDVGHLISVPIGLFEIIDGKVSRYWEARSWGDNTVTLWPPSFYREYYHDKLSERMPDIVEDFNRVYIQLASE